MVEKKGKKPSPANGLQSPVLALSGYLSDLSGTHAAPQFITCHNPRDLRPIQNAVMARILAIKESDPKAKIVVWAGEGHDMPTHRLNVRALLSSCLNSAMQPVYAEEAPYDLLSFYGNRYYGMDVLHRQSLDLSQFDTNGNQLMSIQRIGNYSPYAPEATRCVYEFCASENVRPIATDASIDNRLMLERRDPLNAKFWNAVGSRGEVHAAQPDGVFVRNKIMVHNIFHELKTEGIVLQSAGLAHIFGSNQHSDPSYCSLSAVFCGLAASQEHLYDIKLFPANRHFGVSSIPEGQSRETLSNSIFVDGLDEESFASGQAKDEVHFINSILKNSGEARRYEPLSRQDKTVIRQSIKQFYEDLPLEFRRAGLFKIRKLGRVVFGDQGVDNFVQRFTR